MEANGKIFLDLKGLCALLDSARSTIYNWMNPKSPQYKIDFPRPKKLGNRNRWILTEVLAWIDALPQPDAKELSNP